jgi:transcription elongation factor Elf1
MPQEDRRGFDPFSGNPDLYREEHPASEPVAAGAMIARSYLDPAPPDNPKPEPKQAKCGRCFKTFMARAVWFNGKWCYGAICLACADGNTLPTGFDYARPPTRQMGCPRCGIRRGIEPTLKDNTWHYELTCSHCGQYAISIRRMKRVCDTCKEEYFVDNRWPKRTCHKCSQRNSPY